MKIDRYECDICGKAIANGREYKLSIKFPIPDNVKQPTRYDRSTRITITRELCEECMNKRLKEFGKGEKDE